MFFFGKALNEMLKKKNCIFVLLSILILVFLYFVQEMKINFLY